MRSIFVPALVLGMAFAGSAMAQSSNSTSSGSGTQANSSQANHQPTALNEAQLKQDLEKAGFNNIRVLDAAYLVRATTKDGNTIVMMINPPDVTAVESLNAGSGTHMGGSSGGTTGSSSSMGSTGSGSSMGTTGSGSGTTTPTHK